MSLTFSTLEPYEVEEDKTPLFYYLLGHLIYMARIP